MLSDEEALMIFKECSVIKTGNNSTVMMSFCCLPDEIGSCSPPEECTKMACAAGGDNREL